MDQRIENAQMNILKCFIAQMDSAMKISSIISDHSEDKTLDGDNVICGLIYRLMTPMEDTEMMDSLNKASDIMNGNTDSDSDYDSEEEDEFIEQGIQYDIELKDKPWRNIKRICKIFTKCVRERSNCANTNL